MIVRENVDFLNQHIHEQIIFDGIVGNIDRLNNNSNWAIFMDNATGERWPSAMYDFNWANLKVENENGIEEIARHIKMANFNQLAIEQASHIRDMYAKLDLQLWESNATRLLSLLRINL